MASGNDAVTTGVPISNAGDRARLIEERKNRLPCTLVSNDGLKCGAATWPRCVNVYGCIEAGSCFWRRWHGIPADKMVKKCDPSLD